MPLKPRNQTKPIETRDSTLNRSVNWSQSRPMSEGILVVLNIAHVVRKQNHHQIVSQMVLSLKVFGPMNKGT